MYDPTPRQAGCEWQSAQCVYLNAVPVAGDPLKRFAAVSLTRSKAWKVGSAGSVGESRGWSAPSQGYTLADAGVGQIEALRNVVRDNPSLRCADVPPLVVVPGLTSSAIDYRLDDSAPPPWAFWCPRSTEGWEPLWPIPERVEQGGVGDALCYAADVQVKFDADARSFQPLRANLRTALVDFGSFAGVPGLAQLEAWLTMAGWVQGESLFAAPYVGCPPISLPLLIRLLFGGGEGG